MISHAVTYKVVAYLRRWANAPWFSLLIDLCAFLVTITLTLPVELLVVIGVLISPAWRVCGNRQFFGLPWSLSHVSSPWLESADRMVP